MVSISTHLKNISQNGNFPQIGVKIKNIWNHHPLMMFSFTFLTPPFKVFAISDFGTSKIFHWLFFWCQQNGTTTSSSTRPPRRRSRVLTRSWPTSGMSMWKRWRWWGFGASKGSLEILAKMSSKPWHGYTPEMEQKIILKMGASVKP